MNFYICIFCHSFGQYILALNLFLFIRDDYSKFDFWYYLIIIIIIILKVLKLVHLSFYHVHKLAYG